MTNVMSYGSESKLRLPSCFVEVTDNEMEYTDGCGLFSNICKWVGSIVAGAGLATAVVGVVLAFTPLAPAAPAVVAWGLLGYIGGMYILGLGGLIDINKQDFPSLS